MRGATGVHSRILIVGGSSEIGSSLARSWLGRGTREFIVTERFPGRASDLVDDLEGGGADVGRVILDALDPEAIAPAVESAWSGGDIDLALVALGVLGSQGEIEADPTQAWKVLTVNATATIQVTLEIARRMEEQQHGTIVLLSSVAGQRGRRDNYVYGASKAALDAFAEGLQQRFSCSEVRVLVVRPGYVHSKMSSGVDPAPFAVSIEQSRDQIIDAVDRGREILWIPSFLGYLFYLFKMLPRKLWAAIVSRMR